MKKNLIYILIVFLIILFGTIFLINHSSSPISKTEKAITIPIKLSVEDIKKRGKLIAVTEKNATGYFLYRGEPTGFEYEMLKRFAAHLGVGLEIKVVTSLDSLFTCIINGEADIAASNLTITSERLDKVKFTSPIFKTKQVLVQRIPKKAGENKLIKNLEDLNGKEIHVRRKSAFYSSLKKIQKDSKGKLEFVVTAEENNVEQLIKKVSSGEINYTLADKNVSFISKAFFPNLDTKTEIGPPKKIAWAVNKGSGDLLHEIDEWLKRKETHHAYRVLSKKHFDSPNSTMTMADGNFCSISGNISPYDDIIKKYSTKINWDWRLVAALIAQESRFNHEAESHMGASGLMQLMPETYAYYLPSVDSISPELSIKAGTSYLEKREKYWKQYIFDKEERIKFILASYNVGLGHVLDARRLAIKYDRNPNKWDNNVAYFLKLKSKSEYYNDPVVKHGYCRGEEPVKFVKQILNRYQHYKNLI
jgi:membrane-bound lytic murein transglycosylase F